MMAAFSSAQPNSSTARPDGFPRVGIVGAGITGLSAALRLLKQHPRLHVDVFEASDRAGGTIETEHRDGFLIEHGPDSFITTRPGGLELCRDLGITEELIGTCSDCRRSLVLRNGRPLPVPEGFMLMAPQRLSSILTTPVLSLRGRLRLLAEVFQPRGPAGTDETLASFVRRRFGQEAFDRLVQPLIGGIYTSDPEKLSLQATLPRFPDMEQQFGSVIRGTLKNRFAARSETSDGSGARYGLFVTHRDGLSALIDRLVDALNRTGRCRLHLNCPVGGITPVDDSRTPWQISFRRDATPQRFSGLIVTTPAWIAGELTASLDDRLSGLLRDIEYASTAIVTSTHRLDEFEHPLDAFGLVIPIIEGRDVLAISFSSRKFPHRAPDGHVVLRTFVGGATQPELLDLSDDQILERVQKEMRSLLGLKTTLRSADVWRHLRAMPQYHVGHRDRIAAVEQRMQAHGGLELAGNAYAGVGLPDCITSARQAADRLLKDESLTRLAASV